MRAKRSTVLIVLFLYLQRVYALFNTARIELLIDYSMFAYTLTKAQTHAVPKDQLCSLFYSCICNVSMLFSTPLGLNY